MGNWLYVLELQIHYDHWNYYYLHKTPMLTGMYVRNRGHCMIAVVGGPGVYLDSMSRLCQRLHTSTQVCK
jgi:hypothetical protein